MEQNKFSEIQYNTMRTAFLTAYPKIFTDIPYSVDIFASIKNFAVKKGFSFLPSQFVNEMTIEIEARHKALNCVLDKNLSKNALVIEIAAGLSPRHLQYKNINYVELDYKPVMDIKREIYKTMGFDKLNKTLFDVDISNATALKCFLNKMLKSYKCDKVIILSEGLFWYLTKQEITQITNQFKELLKNVNWVWISSDCPVTDKVEIDYRNVIRNSANLKREKTFVDYTDFSKFFNELGLKNKRYKLSDYVKVNNLSSTKLFKVDNSEAITRINNYTDIAILKVK